MLIFRSVLLCIFLNVCLIVQEQSLVYSELKNYVQNKVIPVVRLERDKLDKELSDSERDRIKRLRWEFREIMRTDVKDDFELSDNSGIEEMIFYFRDNQALIQELLSDAWEIADQHDKSITNLLEPLRKEMKVWKKDWKMITRKYENSGSNNSTKESPASEFDGKFKKTFLPAFFVLWSPDGLLFDHQELNQSYGMVASLSPNPLKGKEVRLKIRVEQTGLYDLSFVTAIGRSALSRALEFNNVGDFEEIIDLIDLSSGDYLVRISNGSVSAFIRFQKM